MDYSPPALEMVLALTQKQRLEPPSPIKVISELLGNNLPVDWGKLGEDPVTIACQNLPLTLLSTLYEHIDTKTMATIALAHHPELSASRKRRFLKELGQDKWLRGIANYQNDPSYARTCEGTLLKYRRFFARLAAPELCGMFGYNFQKQFSTPLKAIELAVGYDPHFPNLINRAAGTQIPLEVRQLDGRLKFAQQIRAQESIFAGLCQEVIFTMFVKAHYLRAIRIETEQELGIKAVPVRWTFELTDGEVSDEQVEQFMDRNPLLQAMRTIIVRDYHPDYLILGRTTGIDRLGRAAHQTAVLLNDPAINAPLCDFPTMEDITCRHLQIPETPMHDHIQTYITQLSILSALKDQDSGES
jgi:hypothetical protein